MQENDQKKLIERDGNLSISKYFIDENDPQPIEETQDLFLESQLDRFLNELPQILQSDDTKSEKKEEISDELLYLHTLIDDCEINLNENDILNFLQIEKRWPFKYFEDIENPRPDRPDIYGYDCPIQAIVEGGHVSFTDFYDREGRFVYDQFKKFYDLGFTFMLSDVMDLTPELRDLSSKIRNYTGTRPCGNFYITNGESKNPRYTHSWKPHKHPYAVTVKVIYGTVKWVIGNNPEKYFSTGDSIFIPNETTHSVVECPGKRLSLTINLP